MRVREFKTQQRTKRSERALAVALLSMCYMLKLDKKNNGKRRSDRMSLPIYRPGEHLLAAFFSKLSGVTAHMITHFLKEHNT